MPRAKTNGIEIEYEEFGAASGRPLLLIMGLGAQMVLWEEAFCEQLAERGHRVIRYDNRDVGLSSKLDAAGMPDVMAAMGASMARRPVSAPYTLSDMAADAVGLLDALDIPKAHIVGASMGGMIAQTLAIEHPARVLTLTSIMSTTGNPALPPPSPQALSALIMPPPADRDAAIERGLHMFRIIGSPGFPLDEERIRRLAGRSWDRGGFHPQGVARHLVAILASGSRKEKLAAVRVPTLVIHGDADPLVPYTGGLDTAEAVPGATLLTIEGMGHDLPAEVWPRIIEGICELTGAGSAGG
jgi:pimeloyl-ACP methyl ester carboxylesterase